MDDGRSLTSANPAIDEDDGAVNVETDRLILRPWRDEDREPFAELNADPVVMEHFPGTLARAESESFANRIAADFARHGAGLWAVEVKEGAPFIGYVGLARPRFLAHFTPAVEIGWRLARDQWGHGYATEAASRCLPVAFDDLGLDELVSFTTPQNVRSRRVMERIGMTHNPNDDFDHPQFPDDARLRRHVLYRLSRSQWRSLANPALSPLGHP